jgi:hypothetical protein
LSGGTASAAFDAVLLVETASVGEATAMLSEPAPSDLARALASTTVATSVFAGFNVRRIGPVDHERQGVFLFNYFSAQDAATNLFAWQYTAGWFQDQTGLDNSTVVQPTHPRETPYTLVNHCRWDRLRDVLPALLFKRSFRSFVLRVFAAHGVLARPLLYRLHRAHRSGSPPADVRRVAEAPAAGSGH